MNEIRPADVIAWQNKMLAYKDEKGNTYSETYLKTVHNQLSAIFNHAIRYYELKSNPAAKAGNMGKAQTKEIEFWTKEEYLKFSEAMMDKPLSFYAFEMLYWCGIRLGGILLQLYKFMEQKIKTIFYNINFLIISNFIPFKMCKK